MVHHIIQTNATLINKHWCEFFVSQQFRVGVSIDGPVWANVRRVGWSGAPAFNKIMYGIDQLRKANIPFSAICVVNYDMLDKARELYNFFVELECASLGINIEEHLDVHDKMFNSLDNGVLITKFWQELFIAWQENPVIKVREFSYMLPSLLAMNNGQANMSERYDLFPSIAWNGDVVLRSPEFLNTIATNYDNFVIGNILNEDLRSILKRGETALYIQDFLHGVSRCQEECEYFSLCHGGQAGNKFFEHGTTDATETVFCRNSVKRLADGILQELESQTT